MRLQLSGLFPNLEAELQTQNRQANPLLNQGLARVSNRPQIPDWKQRPAFSPKGAGLSHGGCKPFYRAGTGLPRRDSDSENTRR